MAQPGTQNSVLLSAELCRSFSKLQYSQDREFLTGYSFLSLEEDAPPAE